MKVSVIIPAYNEEKYIGQCLTSLLKQTYEDLEIIVIDDGSEDKTRGIIKKFPVKLLTQEHKGPGEARNLGAKKAQGEILVFVDADMKFHLDYVKILVEPILKGEAIGTSHRFEYIANLDNIWARCWSIKKIEETEEVKYGLIFRAIRRDKFLKVGGFNPQEGFFDDANLFEKLKKPSLRTNAVCYHHNPSSLGEVFSQAKWISGSFVLQKRDFKQKLKKSKYLILLTIVALFFLSLWLGIIYSLLFLLLMASLGLFFLTIKRVMKERFLPYLVALPIFYLVKGSGIFVGVLTQIFYLLIKKIQGQEARYNY